MDPRPLNVLLIIAGYACTARAPE